MASKQSCEKYQFDPTLAGPKIPAISDRQNKDEESPADYNTGGYLPVLVGDVFKNDRYTVVRKLGWGHFSTVWLVRDNQLNRHSALKVVKSAGRYAETAHDEIKLLSLIARASPTHPGRNHIVSFLDSFSHNTSATTSHYTGVHRNNISAFVGSQSSISSHVCIVFEPLGENLLAMIERSRKKGIARPIVKIIARQVLLGLQYLHDECRLVHTDIKPENILISISDIESHIRTELTLSPQPTSRRVGVPLPPVPHSRSHAHTSRSTRAPDTVVIPHRQVHIFDSQPLCSPGRSSRSASKAKATSANYVFSGITANAPISNPSSSLPTKSTSATSKPPNVRPPPPSSFLLSQTTATNATHSSSASSSSPSSISSIFTTPATSLGNSSTFAMSCVMTSTSINSKAKFTALQNEVAAAVSEPIVAGWAETHRYEAGWRDSVASSLRVSSATLIDAGSTALRSSPKTVHHPPSPLNPLISDSVQINLRPARTVNVTSRPSTSDSPRPSISYTERVPSSFKRSSLLRGKSSPIGPSSLPRQGSAWIAAPAPAVIVAASVAAVASCGDVPESTIPEIVIPTRLPSVPSLLSRTAPPKLFSSHQIQASSGSISSNSSSVTPVPPASPAVEPAERPTTPPPTPASPTSTSPVFTSTIAQEPDVPEMHLPPAIDTSTPPPPISVKIADLGNATPVDKHYTEDIQTRQYRAPEAILGRNDWGTNTDIWSLACVLFELLTAEYLFDPRGQGDLFTKDDDHMAQIIELLGDFPLDVKMGGKYGREMFDSAGSLRYIRTLKPWPLRRVMVDKYLYTEEESKALTDFLLPMLAPDFRDRKEARDLLDHPWLWVGEEESAATDWSVCGGW